jgi:hypothetical protein
VHCPAETPPANFNRQSYPAIVALFAHARQSFSWLIKVEDFLACNLERDVRDAAVYVENGLNRPNPHIYFYGCNTTGRAEISKKLREGDIDGALFAAVQMVGGVNYTDRAVLYQWNAQLAHEGITPEELRENARIREAIRTAERNLRRRIV